MLSGTNTSVLSVSVLTKVLLGVKARAKFTEKLRLLSHDIHTEHLIIPVPILTKEGQMNFDVSSFFIYLKCSWIKRFTSCILIQINHELICFCYKLEELFCSSLLCLSNFCITIPFAFGKMF